MSSRFTNRELRNVLRDNDSSFEERQMALELLEARGESVMNALIEV